MKAFFEGASAITRCRSLRLDADKHSKTNAGDELCLHLVNNTMSLLTANRDACTILQQVSRALSIAQFGMTAVA